MNVVVFDETEDFAYKRVERDLAEFGVQLDVREPLPRNRDSQDWCDWMAWHTAFAKVREVNSPPPNREPADLEVRKEREALTGEGTPPGPFYDGHRLLEAYHGPLPDELATPGQEPVVVLTDRLVGTYEDRYHVRFLVTGHPTIVSPPGFIDGPARDRAFYMAKQALGSAHDANEVVDDDHLTRGDERIPTCVASAILQTVAYDQTGDPFCEDDTCRLFNPHWQKDLIGSMATTNLCEEHEALLD
jgi:hypothetical protein